MTVKEKADCSKRLTPQELKQLDIGKLITMVDYSDFDSHRVLMYTVVISYIPPGTTEGGVGALGF